MAGRLRKGRWAFLLTAFFHGLALAQDPNLCAACHGVDGNATTAGVPSIAGQPKLFLENQLVLFREGLRPSDQMQAATKGLKDPEIIRLAVHFSQLPFKALRPLRPADAGLLNRGEELARQHRCGVCHLSDFSGQNQVPRLAGQDEDYLLAEMKAYQANERRGGDTIMAAALYGLKAPDLIALAHFLARASARSPARPATKGPSAPRR